MHRLWKEGIQEHIETIQSIHSDTALLHQMDEAARIIVQSFQAGGKLLICGNGGSAADSQHIAAELVSRFLAERKALDAEALTVNTSSLTAIGNDYGYERVFARQVEAKGRAGDVLIGISTSGNSKNVIAALESAKAIRMKTVGLTGNNKNGLIRKVSDYCIAVPSASTPRIQEAHILIGHMLCEFIEKELFPQG